MPATRAYSRQFGVEKDAKAHNETEAGKVKSTGMGHLGAYAGRSDARFNSHHAPHLHQGIHRVLHRQHQAEADMGDTLQVGLAVHPHRCVLQEARAALKCSKG